jgi:hypothetical protein
MLKKSLPESYAGDFTSSTFRIFRPLPSAYPTDLGWASNPEGTTSKTFSFTKAQTLRQNHMGLRRAALSGSERAPDSARWVGAMRRRL